MVVGEPEEVAAPGASLAESPTSVRDGMSEQRCGELGGEERPVSLGRHEVIVDVDGEPARQPPLSTCDKE